VKFERRAFPPSGFDHVKMPEPVSAVADQVDFMTAFARDPQIPTGQW
jgi:hypothetical protein